MGINFGVSANSLADGTSIIASNNKLTTAGYSNNGFFLLNNDSTDYSAQYSFSVAASTTEANFTGMWNTTDYPKQSGSVYFTPKHSGNIYVSWVIYAGGSTTGTFPVGAEIVYGSQSPPPTYDTTGAFPPANFISPAQQIVLNGDAPWQQAVSGSALITGLSIGQQYWFDILFGVFGTGATYSNAITCNLYNVFITWYEL